MLRLFRVLAPVLVLAGFGWGAWLITQSSPAVSRVAVSAPQITVATQTVTPEPFTVQLSTFGRVQPRTQSELVAQVSGQVIAISEHFRDGGYVKKGELLLRVDPVDYEVQVDIAEGEVVEAELALEEEQARAGQARKDWEKIGGLDSASDFALRISQLRAAKSRVATAKARLRQAKVNLERTFIKAPFAGRLLQTHVDVGAVVSPQLVLAELYATDYVEVRLPLKSADLAYIELPEAFRRSGSENFPKVSFRNTLTNPEQIWYGRVVRTEGAIDAASQQLYVIAQIDDPFGLGVSPSRYPLKIGQFLPASIVGKTLDSAIIIPASVIYQGSFVYLVKDGVLLRQAITIGFQSDNQALVLAGINPGDEVVLTTLGQLASGTPVTVMESSPTSSADDPVSARWDAPKSSEAQP